MHRAHSLPFTHEHGFVSPPLSSASSTAFEVPTVLVHPPEDEDEAMPFCAFDASQEVAESEMVFTTPEMELVQSELDDWPEPVHPNAEHAPAFHRSQTDSAVIMPRRSAISHSSLSRIMTPPGLPSIPESPKRAKEKDDDDIVEVMKVRRGEGMPDVTYAHAHGAVPTLRRSKTLRSRAAQALRSIKNVGKAPRRPPLGQVFPAKENELTVKTEVPTQAPSTVDKHRAKAKVQPSSTQATLPRLKKRVSQPLANLFGGGSESVVPSASDAIDFGVSPSHSGGFRTFSYSRKASASTPALQLLKDESARPISPTSLRGTRPKFSFVNLQSIFSGNMQPVPAEPQQAEVSPDVDDDAVPQTPVDDGWDSGEDYDSPRRRVDPGRVPRCSDENAYPEQEISFEMRLNSLHFDSFNIDTEEF